MKNTIKNTMIFFVCLLFVSMISCKNEQTSQTEEVSEIEKTIAEKKISIDFINSYQGKLGDKNLSIKLESNSGAVKGKYHTANSNNEYLIKGDLKSSGELTLNVYNEAKGHQIGKIIGDFENQNKFQGDWKNALETKSEKIIWLSTNTPYEFVKKEVREQESKITEKSGNKELPKVKASNTPTKRPQSDLDKKVRTYSKNAYKKIKGFCSSSSSKHDWGVASYNFDKENRTFKIKMWMKWEGMTGNFALYFDVFCEYDGSKPTWEKTSNNGIMKMGCQYRTDLGKTLKY